MSEESDEINDFKENCLTDIMREPDVVYRRQHNNFETDDMMLPKDWQFLNEIHRKNTEACLEEVRSWSQHPFSHEEIKQIFQRQKGALRSKKQERTK